QGRRNGVEFSVARTYHRIRTVHREFIHLNFRLCYVDGQDQDRQTSLRQRRLASEGGLSLGLAGSANLVAEDAGALVHSLEIDLLGEVEADLIADNLTGDQNHWGAVSMALIKPFDEM